LTRANDDLQKQIAERKRVEQELQTFATALERSNGELQHFGSIASHDLQEPLRKIIVFGDRLATKAGDALNAEGRDYLARMQASANRMQTLINDLLTFSRVSTRTQPFVPVDLAAVARDVLSDLEVRIEQVGGQVEVGSLPIVAGDPTQMRQLLQNLIGNALKFRNPDQPPVVKVSSIILNGDGASVAHLVVEDNGIGFDEKYLDRIFAIFQRLHSRTSYEGSGVGLAVCRKIVERHGGTITARSQPGQGAAFVVTLPVRPSNPKEAR
jgi:light-regulated signal transduction histidine kinase (bacteriophytochrome)